MVEHKFNWKNDGRLKIMIGCGTRPEIIRLAAVMKRWKSPGTVLLDSFCEWKKSTRTVPGDF